MKPKFVLYFSYAPSRRALQNFVFKLMKRSVSTTPFNASLSASWGRLGEKGNWT